MAEWYTPNKLLSRNRLVNLTMSERGTGKSVAFKKFTVDQYLKFGNQSVYLRRRKEELDITKGTYFNELIDLEWYPEYEFKVEGNKGFIRKKVGDEDTPEEDKPEWEVCIHFIPLSLAFKYKGIAFPKVRTIFYDEVLVKRDGGSGYLKNEMGELLDLMSTVFRRRMYNPDEKCRVVMAANSISYVNPFFDFYGVKPKPGEEFPKTKSPQFCVEIQQTGGAAKKEMEETDNPWFSLIRGTEYADYAVGNEVLEDSEEFIADRPSGNIRLQCMLRSEGKVYGVWYKHDTQEVFIDTKTDDYCPFKFFVSHDDATENYLPLPKTQNRTFRTQCIRKAWQDGLLRFDTQNTKKAFIDYIIRYI